MAMIPADVVRIGLCMIVKNEAAIIERCLASVRPFVDYVFVEDTGSTDGTQDIIRRWLLANGVPGEVIEVPWQDFATNRTIALEELRRRDVVNYAFVMDADDLFEADAQTDLSTLKATLNADYYHIEILHGGVKHHRVHLLRSAKPFRYRGVLHEYIEVPPDAATQETLQGIRILASTSGARSQNPNKYRDDAAVLEAALARETDPFLISRYTFYLAQSYQDSAQPEKALQHYLARGSLGFWEEEEYVSLKRAGDIMAMLGRPFEEVVACYEKASSKVPARAEALHAAAKYCRDVGRNVEGADYGRRGSELPAPSGGLFIEPWVYDYGALDEFAVNAYWAGRYRDSLHASLKLLAERPLPDHMRDRVLANARFAAGKIDGDPVRGSFGREDFVAQHERATPRTLFSPQGDWPTVLVTILAKQKAECLPLYLKCISQLDYPKDRIKLYVRTNNNTDQTEAILRKWLDGHWHQYAHVEFDPSNVSDAVERFGVHEWNAERFSVLGRIRQVSLAKAAELGCDFYFVADVDNFLRPQTLRELVSLRLPIVAPLLRAAPAGAYYSNFHAEIDENGYFAQCDQYNWIILRHVRGIIEVPVVHCTYLVRTDVAPYLRYDDRSGRYEYVIFSDSARKAGIPQYLDNRQVYGYIGFQDGPLHFPGDIDLIASRLDDGVPA